ncbi:MAG: beta-ketoacyl-ACP synthase II [Alphaproteobacteria bacterium]|nr:beta-ketoacyl-ACP synthase II [Alphaproteobacteria bacterium]
MKKVVITGLGIVCPVGTGVQYAWKNLLDGKSGIKAITEFDVSEIASKIAGVPHRGTEPGDYNPDIVVDPKEQRRMENTVIYGLVAADEAIKDANLEDYDGDKNRIGVCVGSGVGGLGTIETTNKDIIENGPRFVSPFFVPKAVINMTSGHISIKYGFGGPNIAMATACATGAHSIGEAAEIIKRGDADIMICGGTEAAVCPLGIIGFSAMRALSTRNDEPEKASRPWDKDRDGFVMGEGAGILVLEEYEHAIKRGAKIYAEVAGFGMTADAHHITAPAPNGEGGKRAMLIAMEKAGVQSSDIDYVNAHGTSTGLGDVGELIAVKELFGNGKTCMSSTKSMTGHLLGAAGAIEAIFCALSIRDNIVPPTINLENPIDEVGDFNLVPNVAQKHEVNVALSNSFGFGGTNASLILKRVK